MRERLVKGREVGMTKRAGRFILFFLLGILPLAGCGSSVENAASPQVVNLAAASQEFPNASLLVAPDSVESSLNADKLVIVDARSPADYNTAHIPGAINMQHSDYWVKGAGLKDTPALASQLGAAGISRAMTIVIYDNTAASWGAAGRLFWMLEYLGCTDVHIMNGGWDKWSADKRPVTTTSVTLPAAIFTPQLKSSAKSTSGGIAARLYDNDFAVIDTRTPEEFNGWQLYGETRGGHIPRAVNIPYAWFYNSDKTTLSYQDLKNLFESKGITQDKEVTAHCTAGIRSGYAYFLLRLMGYSRCSNYDASIWDWADNTSLPMEKSPNYASLVYPSWIKALIDYHKAGSTTAPPPGYSYDRNHKYQIFETQWGSLAEQEAGEADNSYLLGHIPGAVHSNSDTYENGFPRWFLLPEAELKTALGTMGITADTTVVVYSDSPIFAARLWWILKYAGVTDVRYLNGGYKAWLDAGYAGEATVNNPTPTVFDGAPAAARIATTAYVEANYTNTATTQVVDVRSGSEYAGLISGYGYVVNKGRIPNAIWAYDASDASVPYMNADGTLRSYAEVRDMWSGLGLKSTLAPDRFDKEVIFTCGSGYRSSLAYLQAYLMGYTNVRNYSDGWEGWSTTYTEDPAYHADPAVPGSTEGWRQDPSGRPVETGWPVN